jgi:protoporphyrinogen/coproporphyrinogen III oxidase
MRIVVVGGGITGLAAAHRALELGCEQGRDVDVRLLEAGDHAGGVIATTKREGCVLELGPDSMITDKPWGLDLAKRLGLQDQIVGTQDQHRRSFVVRGGKLHPVPEGFQILAPTRFGPLIGTPIFSLPGKARMALDLVLPPRKEEGDESLGSFVLRRLGREALERMADPMVAGIYGADPMTLSLQATMPRFLEMERKHGSVIRGMWARSRAAAGAANGQAHTKGVSGARYGLFASFREGLQTLTDALAARLAGRIEIGTRVESLKRTADGWRLETSRGPAEADAVILALPAYRSGTLLEGLDAQLGASLNAIKYASAGTMSLCYRTEDVPHPLDGFGFVVPRSEGLHLMGCTFTHRKYPLRAPAGVALLRAFLGEKALDGRDDAEVERLVREDFRKLLGITAPPQFVVSWRGQKCMPHYEVGHLERVAEMERRAAALPGLQLAGNAYYGVGIPDSIHSGELAAERVLVG